ncbi:NAD(P)/FAD-dependent oxidoreductase [Robbsia sp. KACC 23696]|uniref:NAD(P)/FAD-dependent oxidoreductase n=1 Tax=Robbsia sp. KACC 23696 TaxID=3149231 RepID=UPI00325B4B94
MTTGDGKTIDVDVAVIGAGPAGAVAAALLRRDGHRVRVIERQQFPRFSIGESLLPQSMAYIEEAGMLQAVVEAGFQYKNGAAFFRGEERSEYDFRDKSSPGWGTTFQVVRADFDNVLARCAAEQGADVRFGETVTAFRGGATPELDIVDAEQVATTLRARFVLDASGFGRVLPRLLQLETPTGLPQRAALFGHFAEGDAARQSDRTKIGVFVHPSHRDVWFWRIPLSDGRSSIGCVAAPAFLSPDDGLPLSARPESEQDAWREARLRALIAEEPLLARLFDGAPLRMPVRTLTGYSANVASLHGDGYALLGNAGEFLDPVFSSGVTIAVRSAHQATQVLKRQLRGEAVDWQREYDAPLRKGIDTFRAFVERWYSGELQDIIFYKAQTPMIRRMISAVLAGYAWDESNPYVKDPVRRLNALHAVCALPTAG